MQKPDRSSFTVLDFTSWEDASTLSLAPKFQRRSVWKLAARTYLIDTLLKGMPIPPLYLRVTQNEPKTRTIREVIDGQQRLRSVLDFVRDEFALVKSVSEIAPGKRFSQLTDDQKDSIRKYSFICEVFSSISDAEVLEIFARMNTYSVKLNSQELRNGRYFGPFKRVCYRLALEHLEFWRRNHVFTDASIARMLEVELTSELLVAEIDGAQDKKKSLDAFYAKFDEVFPEEQRLQERFRATIDGLTSTFGESFPDIEFRRPPLFYSLFCVAYHRMFGLPNANLHSSRTGRLSKNDAVCLKDAILALSEVIERAREQEPVRKEDDQFVQACLRQTDNIRPREIRFQTMYNRAFS